jgi:hypothetical protein
VHRQVLVHRGGGDTVGDAEAQRDDGQKVQDVVGVLQERLQRGELKKPKKTLPKRRGFFGATWDASEFRRLSQMEWFLKNSRKNGMQKMLI